MIKKIFPYLALTILIALFVSCWTDNYINKTISNIYINRNELVKLFDRTDITKRGEVYFLEMHDDNGDSSYFFRFTGFNPSKNKKLQLLDTINEKQITFLCRRFNNKSTFIIKEYLLSYTFKLLKTMYDLHIKSESCSFEKQGITNLYYISAEYVVMYISDQSKVNVYSWIEQIKESKKIDENWYYYKRK